MGNRFTTKLAAAFIVVGTAIGAATAEEQQKTAEPPKPAEAQTPAGAEAVGSGWSAEVAPNSTSGLTLDEKQTEVVKKVNEYFNALTTLKGAFVQTTADKKRMKGKFFVKKPGKFRFDYSLPSKQIIISDGEYLAI